MKFIHKFYDINIFHQPELCQNLPAWIMGHLRKMAIMDQFLPTFLKSVCCIFSYKALVFRTSLGLHSNPPRQSRQSLPLGKWEHRGQRSTSLWPEVQLRRICSRTLRMVSYSSCHMPSSRLLGKGPTFFMYQTFQWVKIFSFIWLPIHLINTHRLLLGIGNTVGMVAWIKWPP